MKMPGMKCPSLVAAAVVFFFLSSTALSAAGAIVEHTFVVSQLRMRHLCKETLVTVVNGQLPGPTIEVTEGDSVAVHVVNMSPNNVTIHWHGLKQMLSCWADGVPMVTQRPILPNHNFTYRFNIAGQEGTLWWHAHVPFLRATLHGAFIIRPRRGVASYPFPKPDKEIPVIIGEWWEANLVQAYRHLKYYVGDDYYSASTINGKLGDVYNCSGAVEEGYMLDVEPGKTYLLRVINAALFSEYYLKIAGHRFTVVASDANYVRPYTTDIIAISPGETVDALMVADASPGRYYMVALPTQPPKPDFQSPVLATRGAVQYSNSHGGGLNSYRRSNEGEGGQFSDDVAEAPKMPDDHDMMLSFYFHGNMTGLHHREHPAVPVRVDEHLFITLGLGSVCRRGQYCERGKSGDDKNITIVVATMNNVSFQLPSVSLTSLLEAHYYNTVGIGTLQEFPNRPPRVFDFTDRALIPEGPKEAQLEPTSRATVAQRFRHGAVVDVVFQSTSMMQSESNPMHLHGHDMFVLAQGLGNYDAARDVLVDPPLKNTVFVPRLGWVAVRFVADNPGIWYMHCHFEFHQAMGMTALFIVENGPTVDTSLPPPPADFSTTCDHDNNLVPDEFYLHTIESEVPLPRIDGV